MFNSQKNKLHMKVNAFKVWAKSNYPAITEKNDNGEWCFGLEFDEMVSEALNFVDKNLVEKADQQIIDDILYVIARDNELGDVITELEKYTEWFSLLCRYSLKTDYVNAKWQFVEHLSNYEGNDNLHQLVYDFLDVGDEYTERLALKTLADIYPEKAEQYAVEFWKRQKYDYDEYQKIMVLHVLYQIHSPQLSNYLKIAEQSNYNYLKLNAQEIMKNLLY